MDRIERLAESVIKSVLELLRSNPSTEFSELQLEQGTREKILNKPVILERLRKNPKIIYNSVTARYKFKPAYPLTHRADLMDLIAARASLLVDTDLLECYKAADDDVSALLVSKKVIAVRQADAERTIKCEVAAAEAVKTNVRANTLPKCSLYSANRCTACSDNMGLVLMRRFSEIPTISDEIKELWFSVDLPHISEIQRAAVAEDRDLQQHLAVSSTQHILTKSSLAKLKAAGGRGRRKRTVQGSWKSDTLANEHVAEHLTSNS